MGRKATNKEDERTIQKSKRSYYVTLPIRDVRALAWREGRKVCVRRMGRRLVIEESDSAR